MKELHRCEPPHEKLDLNENDPEMILQNPPKHQSSFWKFGFWCCCIFGGFIVILMLASLGQKRNNEKIHLVIVNQIVMPKPIDGAINFSTPTVISAEFVTEKPTEKPTVSRITVPKHSTTENPRYGGPICSNKSCRKAVAALKSRINQTTPPCQSFFDHACGIHIHRQKARNLTGNSLDWVKKVGEFIKEHPERLVSTAEINVKKVYKKCLNRNDSEAEDLMTTMKSYFAWPFQREFESEDDMYFLHRVLNFIVKINPESVQLFKITASDGKFRIQSNFCLGPHKPINVNLLRRLFKTFSKKSKPDVMDNLEKSLKMALEVDKSREYCIEHSTPAVFEKPEDANLTSVHIDFRKALDFFYDFEIEHFHELYQPDSFLNQLLGRNAIGVAHYLVIKYMEDVSIKLFFPDKSNCAKMIFSMMPHTFSSIYINHILYPEKFRLKLEIAEKVKSEYLDQISKSKNLREHLIFDLVDKVERCELTGDPIERRCRNYKVHEEMSFYTDFRELNYADFFEAYRHSSREMHGGRKEQWSFNQRISLEDFDINSKILSDPLPNPELPMAIRYGQVGYRIALQWAKGMEVQYDFEYLNQTRCLKEAELDTSMTMDLLSMKTSWNAYKKLDLKNEVRLEGLENITDDQLFFYSVAQTACDKGSEVRTRMHKNLRQIEGFRKSFQCEINPSIENIEHQNCGPL